MPPQFWIYVALFVSIVAFVACIWQFANIKGYKARGRRRVREPDKKTRYGDRRVLTGYEKRLYGESQRLLGQGKIQSGARILEQLNMQREAIQALEDAGLIHEAAKILMRMQRHNRAGVVYARHAMWEHAAQSFRVANMPLEVAKCAREAGNPTMAGEFFEKAGRFDAAARSWEQAGELQKAARLYTSAGQTPKAMKLYDKLVTAAEDITAIEFEENELQTIVDYIGEGHIDVGLTDVIVNCHKLKDVLLNLVGRGLMHQASGILLRATSDIGPQLMAEVNYQNRSAETLAEVFLSVASFHYAGMVYERMNAFELAGNAFEKAEDFERAAYCYERAGFDRQVKLMKEKARNAPVRIPDRVVATPFAFSNVAQNDDSLRHNVGFGDGESTAVLDPNAQNATATPPPSSYRHVPAPPPSPYRHVPAPPPSRRRHVPAPPPPRADAGQFRLGAVDETKREEPSTHFAQDFIERDDADESSQRRRSPGDMPVPKKRAGMDTQDIERNDEARVLLPLVAKIVEESIALDEGRAVFHKAKFFADLDFEQKNSIWQIGLTHDFDTDQTILTYDDEPKGVYVITQGSVSCYRQVNGKENYVDQMGESETFGELWLLADQPTAVHFVASKDTKVRVIDRLAFTELLDKDGTIARKLYKRFTMRLLKRLLKSQNSPRNKVAS